MCNKKASKNIKQAKINPTLEVQYGTDRLHKRTAAKWLCRRGGENQTALDQKTKYNFSSVSDHCLCVCVGLSTHRKPVWAANTPGYSASSSLFFMRMWICMCVWSSVCVYERKRGVVSVGVCKVFCEHVCVRVCDVVAVWVCVRERGREQVCPKWGGEQEIRRELVTERDLLSLQYPVFSWFLFLSVHPLLCLSSVSLPSFHGCI